MTLYLTMACVQLSTQWQKTKMFLDWTEGGEGLGRMLVTKGVISQDKDQGGCTTG